MLAQMLAPEGKACTEFGFEIELTVAAVKRFMDQAIDLGFWMGLCYVGITLSDKGLLSGDKWNSKTINQKAPCWHS